MIFLHSSLEAPKFKDNKKLNLLKKGVITPAQFVNLIDPLDPYILFGPAVIDKTKVREFMLEWKARQLKIEEAKSSEFSKFSLDDAVEGFGFVEACYPEAKAIISQYREQIKIASCPKCTKNNAVSAVVAVIQKVDASLPEDKKRDLGQNEEYFKLLLGKYGQSRELLNTSPDFDKYDVEWIDPESIVGLGKDLINGISSCIDCSMKHIGRAKILHEEFMLGYPDYKGILEEELFKGNKALEELYLVWLDAQSQLDMSSAELAGDISSLSKEHAAEIIEIANEIRKQRLLYHESPENAPDFDGLRIKLKKLQLAIASKKA